ncbi:ShET2/EspL2 family type III secretion system effector toxin [Paludibacterium paludis]|uniref:ShET2 enterotoxin N-terminal domain-containing protein n=1 Tax=Paludibacterium paludis TaxID=1225769 RepID=A0A918P170_9NEIS|nr:ShET2/EspL2 family type III secretion system effector toxin [Paludibacterium paludis]GGY13040.1 hypothetical protein GCM10011289_15280 [Paludibacterium paludis]
MPTATTIANAIGNRIAAGERRSCPGSTTRLGGTVTGVGMASHIPQRPAAPVAIANSPRPLPVVMARPGNGVRSSGQAAVAGEPRALTPLQDAIRHGSRQMILRELDQELAGGNASIDQRLARYEAALASGNRDHIKALVLLGLANENRIPKPASAATDKPASVDKSRPYITKGDARINLNGRVTFENRKDPIYCRHLSLAYLSGVPREKLKAFSSAQGIRKHAPYSMEAMHNEVINGSAENHLIVNNRLNIFLQHEFLAMKETGNAIRKYILSSLGHSLGMILECKKSDYVIRVYDPNVTSTDMRVRVHALNDLPESLQPFLKYYWQYFKTEDDHSLAFRLSEQGSPMTNVRRHVTIHYGESKDKLPASRLLLWAKSII